MCVICRSVSESLNESNFRKCRSAFGDVLCDLRRFRKSRALGKRVGADQFRLIVGGNPIASDQMIETECRKKSRDANQNDDAPMCERPVQHPEIEQFE